MGNISAEKRAAYWQQWAALNRTRLKTRDAYYHYQLRMQFLEAYGGKCVCCGEPEPDFLVLAHLNDDGADHRRRVGAGTGPYKDLRKRGWPQDEGIGILCANCNTATTRSLTCPHRRVVL